MHIEIDDNDETDEIHSGVDECEVLDDIDNIAKDEDDNDEKGEMQCEH